MVKVVRLYATSPPGTCLTPSLNLLSQPEPYSHPTCSMERLYIFLSFSSIVTELPDGVNDIPQEHLIGEKPSERLHVEIEAQLTNGVLVTVDSDTLHFLMRRRGQATKLGPWIEVHYSHDEEE